MRNEAEIVRLWDSVSDIAKVNQWHADQNAT